MAWVSMYFKCAVFEEDVQSNECCNECHGRIEQDFSDELHTVKLHTIVGVMVT